MPEEAGEAQSDKEGMPISAIFALEELVTSDCRTALVSRVLHEFPNLPEPARQSLRAAVNDEVIPTSGGFRRGQAGRALDGLRTILQEPVESGIRASNKLASAVLRCWVDSRPSLREESARFLTERDLSALGPDTQGRQFQGTWPLEQLRSEQELFAQAHEGYEPDEVALMLCYVSGKFPLPADPEAKALEGAEVLSDVLLYLRDLSATSSMWEAVIPNFAALVSGIIEEKSAQLRWAADFDAILQVVRREFGGLLAFFEQDTHQWSAATVSHQADTAAALGLVENLRALLSEYGQVHVMGAGISEERERSMKRAVLQPSILDALQDIDALMTEEAAENPDREHAFEDSELTPPLSGSPDAGSDAPDLPTPSPSNSTAERSMPDKSIPDKSMPDKDFPQQSFLQGGQSAATSATEEPAIAVQETVGVDEFEALQSENSGLRDGSHALRSSNQDLKDEVEALKTELFSSQEREESWRMAYRTAVNGPVEEVEEAEPKVGSVNDAVEMARSRYRQELLFAPNSESNIDENPFIDPGKVWEALQWLANTYYPSKMGRLRVTDFDQSIKEACGWWYKGDQGETTVSKFEKSYTTRVSGKRYTLVEHIGKGTTFDARYTIRIAFDWDREKRQVIVGYIGRHQQTDAS